MENSLDAGATQITVEVKGGGIDLLRVTDNGCGIPTSEVEIAFRRHATSKIARASDLDSVATLGFRGEALPSIAAVARVSLVTRAHDLPAGWYIQLRGGVVVAARPTGCPAGTSVTVEGLFEDLPARRKFLKSPSAEASRIGDLVSRYALSYPEVRFRSLVDGRNALDSPGNGSLGDALISVYGPETAGSLLEAGWDDPGDGYGVQGFVSLPSLHRANRSYITLLVNRRWIQSPLLSFALAESYHGFLPERRHPIAVLNLTVPRDQLDVNVHPAKREVRFRQEDRVFSTLQRGVRSALIATSPVPQVRFAAAPPSWPGPGGRGFALPIPTGDQRQGGPAADLIPHPSSPTPVEAMPYLRVLGQVRNTYLAAEGPDGLYLIDQHAAHERVLFERLLWEAGDRTTQAQALLEPAAVELSPSHEELVQTSTPLLERYGFVLEPFGERTYLVRGLPAVLADPNPAKALQEVLDLMAFEGLLKEREEALAASIACHGAVRAGMSLSHPEMEELLRQLGACQTPHTCPTAGPP